MPYYHLFYMSSENANTIETTVFEASGDDAAVSLVADGNFAIPLELWSGYERIKRFEPVQVSAVIPT